MPDLGRKVGSQKSLDLQNSKKPVVPKLRVVEQDPVTPKVAKFEPKETPKKELTAFEKRRAKFLANKDVEKGEESPRKFPQIPQTEKSAAKPYWAKKATPEYK